jgi:hypothetical protein
VPFRLNVRVVSAVFNVCHDARAKRIHCGGKLLRDAPTACRCHAPGTSPAAAACELDQNAPDQLMLACESAKVALDGVRRFRILIARAYFNRHIRRQPHYLGGQQSCIAAMRWQEPSSTIPMRRIEPVSRVFWPSPIRPVPMLNGWPERIPRLTYRGRDRPMVLLVGCAIITAIPNTP